MVAMKKKIVLCKPVKGGMTEQEKAEAGFLYNPNTTDEMKRYRYKIQDALCEYNKLKPSQVAKRRNFLAKIFGKIGKRCDILPPFRCDYGFHIEVGENFFANYNFVVLDGNYVRIGDNVWIAPNVGIYAAGHPLDVEDRIAGWEYAFPVTIGNNVWIGGGVQIIGGVTIGDNAVVAAGSVVIRDVPANTLVAGNPARIVRRITAKDRQKYAWAPADAPKKSRMKKALLLVAALAWSGMSFALTLEEGFKAPPNSAKPHTWYHMMNGNVTKEGITCDFEALAKAGIGGVQMFDAGCAIPPGKLDFNSPAWFDMFRHAATEARRLGLEICIPNCSGWSSSGGPWNMPSNGMKKVVFTETPVKGPRAFAGKLPRTEKDNGFYEDIAVLAFPTPPADLATFPGVKATVSGKTATLAAEKPFTVQGLSYRLSYPHTWAAAASAKVEVSDDGTTFREHEKFGVPLAQSGVCDVTLRYRPFAKPLTARAIRLTFTSGHPLQVAELRPEGKLRLSDIKAKTFDVRRRIRRDVSEATDAQIVRKDRMVNLTSRLAADGSLTWDVPAGDWTIFRIGYICNGRCNHPASDHGKGLEVDKLSALAMDYHFDQYVTRLCQHLGPLAGNVESGFNNILVDSYEVGSQNWTQGFAQTFERRMGYSLIPYLPVFTGRVVESTDESERFLEDFRRVVADLFAENYAGRLAELCHRHGLLLSVEPYGNAPCDNLQYGQDVDIPMAEFWSSAASGDHATGTGNSKFASYLAHVWGRRYAATESFTASPSVGGRWQTTPFTIKAQGDRVYAAGINRIIYHRFTHQPWPGNQYLPGMTMGRWGMHLDRTQTWWNYADGWFRYQARCQWMLQEGTFVADALFFCGEQAPNQGGNTDGAGASDMKLPDGYDWDICATKAMEMLKVANGRVVVPGGVSYALLVLPARETMSERMLGTVGRLLDAGAKVCALKKPSRAPGLRGYPSADGRVRALADKVWAKGVMTCSPAEALTRLGVAPDFTSTETDRSAGAVYIHRRNAEADWYFVALNNVQSKSFEASFRVTGRQPEIWDAEKGTIVDAPQWREENGRTFVTLDYPPSGSAFVVFRRPASPDHVAEVAVAATRRPDPRLPEPPHTLFIEKAVYGIFSQPNMPEPKLSADITSALAACVKDATLAVAINNKLAHGDPAPLQFKEAYITYVYDGARKTIVVKENANLTLPPDRLVPDPMPDWEWRDGRILAYQPLSATLKTTSGAIRRFAAEPPPDVLVDGEWRVAFPVDWYTGGTARKEVTFASLADWTANADFDIRYFSGTATYAKRVPYAPKAGVRTILDLGTVKNFAEVKVNGKTFPVLWKPPYRVNITDAIDSRSESLDLEIKVTNLWPNRLIGDDALPADCEWKGREQKGVKEIGVKEIPQWVKDGKCSPTGRHTFTTWRHWSKDEDLLPSGLLGPVLLRHAQPAHDVK